MSAAAIRTPSRPRRHDPQRAERILRACLDVIVAEGVDGMSYRKVAAAADVPLGSLTYHFADRDALLVAAFTRFAHESGDRVEEAMARAASAEQARAAVVWLVTGVPADGRDVVLMTELYALAARHARYRAITHAWMARSRRALERHFDAPTARLLAALIGGISLHRALDDGTAEPPDARRAVTLITGTAS